jgi:hypothetical protein
MESTQVACVLRVECEDGKLAMYTRDEVISFVDGNVSVEVMPERFVAFVGCCTNG